MAASSVSWGCCCNGSEEESSIKCARCNKLYHYACLSIEENILTPKRAASWKCPNCLNHLPKGKNDNTPVRNVTTSRGSKRQAVNSPPLAQHAGQLSPDDIGDIVQRRMQKQFDEMLSKINYSFANLLNNKLKSIQSEISEVVKSMEHINDQFEELRKEHKSALITMANLQSENESLKADVNDLRSRLGQLEQHARAKNIEIQCVPEKKTENLLNIVTGIGKVVNCDIDVNSIANCTRVAKLQRETNRPRSIIVEFITPRLRDVFLAACIKYNKANPNNRLNSNLIGIPGVKMPIYIAEHLSPAYKKLHAAARLKAKEKSYNFTWVRNGRIFVRKDDSSAYIWIKDISTLDKIV